MLLGFLGTLCAMMVVSRITGKGYVVEINFITKYVG